ncbi:MAG: hypothetical protein DDT31_00972 [Syntrophomonadaceae bacterium]|nr:hypothetical protein [Bacillota bacterium]
MLIKRPSCPSTRVYPRSSLWVSETTAISSRYIGFPSLKETTVLLISSRPSNSPMVRTKNSRGPSTRCPAGRLRFAALIAPATSGRDRLCASNLLRSISTKNSLSKPPKSLTEATPSIRSKRGFATSSIKSLKSKRSRSPVIPTIRIGIIAISNLTTKGRFIPSGRKTSMTSIIALISLAAKSRLVPQTNSADIIEIPS